MSAAHFGASLFLRCTDVFYVNFDSEVSDLPFDLSQLEQSISWVCREVLDQQLAALSAKPASIVGVRLAVGRSKVGCKCL